MKILYLSPVLELDRPTGGGRHNWAVLSALCRHAEVTVLRGRGWDIGARQKAEQLCRVQAPDLESGGGAGLAGDALRGRVWSFCREYSFAYEQAVGRALHEGAYDLVWADGYYCAPSLRQARHTPSVLMTRDSQTRYHWTRWQATRSPRALLDAARLAWFEKQFYRHASGVVFLSNQDRTFHQRLDPATRCVQVPMGIGVPPPETPADLPVEVPGRILFFGSMDYGPNIDGVRWFVRRVWPVARRRCPGASLVIAGHSPTPAVRDLVGEPGVAVRGFVPDMGSELWAAQVVICPVRYGCGVKTKCLEAMRRARALVATPLGMEGIAGAPGEAYVSASTAGQFADACARLLGDADWRGRLGEAARLAVEEHHNLDRHLDALVDLARQLAGGPLRPR